MFVDLLGGLIIGVDLVCFGFTFGVAWLCIIADGGRRFGFL